MLWFIPPDYLRWPTIFFFFCWLFRKGPIHITGERGALRAWNKQIVVFKRDELDPLD